MRRAEAEFELLQHNGRGLVGKSLDVVCFLDDLGGCIAGCLGGDVSGGLHLGGGGVGAGEGQSLAGAAS